MNDRTTFELARLWSDTMFRQTGQYRIIPIGTPASRLVREILDYEFPNESK
ncbi:MAG: hypothetical protein QM811_03625 [Pirellulales bacterium]